MSTSEGPNAPGKPTVPAAEHGGGVDASSRASAESPRSGGTVEASPREPADSARGAGAVDASPRAPRFDQALGAGLALLTGRAGDEPPDDPEVAAPRARGGAPARTVALHPIIVAPGASADPPRRSSNPAAHASAPSASQSASAQPLSRRRRRSLVALAALAAIGAALVVGVLVSSHPRSPPGAGREPTRPELARPTTGRLPPSQPSTVIPSASPTAPTEIRRLPSPARAAAVGRGARLTIFSQPGASVYIDDSFVHEAPLLNWPVAPGRHLVRVEGTTGGLHLIPKEATVTLQDGEMRRMKMSLE